MFTAPAFAAAMRAEIDWSDSRAVVIDCSAITFMDTSAFHALVYGHRYAIEHGHRLVIGNLRPNCARAIRLCDRDNELTIEAAPDSTVAFPVASSKRRPKARRAGPAGVPRQRHLHLVPTPRGA